MFSAPQGQARTYSVEGVPLLTAFVLWLFAFVLHLFPERAEMDDLMRNDDIVELFELVQAGIAVQISGG